MEIIPLTKDYLKEMYNLVKKVFPYERDEDILNPIEGSLGINMEKNKPWLKEKQCTSVNYFIVIQDNKIIGTTGVYTTEEDENEAYWLAWFCVDPKERGKGIGNKLLEFVIK